MNKKLGLALMFAGAYVTMLGGLFFLMFFYGASHEIKPKDYEWIWGVIVAVIMCIGAVLCCKKNIAGFVGFGIVAVGIGGAVWLTIYGVTKYNTLNGFVLAGGIACLAGAVLGLICHIRDTIKAQKYGESLL